MKHILQTILKAMARSVLRKYRPEIIGITGSLGKTSTKEAIYSVLKDHFNVRRNIKNYNNEIGLPLTILGEESGNKSPLKWLKIILQGLDLILSHDKNYPKILILEMAADRPGDIAYLTKLAPCKIGVLTAISMVHSEFLGNLESVAKEKEVMITHLRSNSFAVVNQDDKLINKIIRKTNAEVMTFGFSQEAKIRASEIAMNYKKSGDHLEYGTSFKIFYQGHVVPAFLPGSLGNPQIYAALSAVAVGLAYNLNLMDIVGSLKKYRPPLGRMNLLLGIKGTIIVDDTYNAAPASTISALEVAKELTLPEGKKYFAVLGDMLELGDYTLESHEKVGERVVELGFDVLITVGERAVDIARRAKEQGMDENKVFTFSGTKEAGLFLQDRIEEGDLILIKGSQGMRMEKITKELMAEPLQACNLLVRHDAAWECR